MKHLYYGAWEYTETKDSPKNTQFVTEYGRKGYLLTSTDGNVPAVYFDGTLYVQSRRYRDGETAGKRIHELNVYVSVQDKDKLTKGGIKWDKD